MPDRSEVEDKARMLAKFDDQRLVVAGWDFGGMLVSKGEAAKKAINAAVSRIVEEERKKQKERDAQIAEYETHKQPCNCMGCSARIHIAAAIRSGK